MHITEILPNLPPAVSFQTFHTLTVALPPPATDSPAERIARDEEAAAAVTALNPTDAFEARLAARIVAADAHAMDCLRLAILPGQDPVDVRRNRAQANSMMRQSQSALHALQRIQAKHEKAEAEMHPAAMERAGYYFRDVSVPAAPSEGRAPTPHEAPRPAPSEPNPPDIVAEAEQYALIYPDRAARIRALGRLPHPCDFGPPSPELVHALVTGTTPILRALDTQARRHAA